MNIVIIIVVVIIINNIIIFFITRCRATRTRMWTTGGSSKGQTGRTSPSRWSLWQMTNDKRHPDKCNDDRDLDSIQLVGADWPDPARRRYPDCSRTHTQVSYLTHPLSFSVPTATFNPVFYLFGFFVLKLYDDDLCCCTLAHFCCTGLSTRTTWLLQSPHR